MTARHTLNQRLRHLLGAEGFLDDAASRLVYASDSSHLTLGRPLGVALPSTIDQLRDVVAACVAAGVPVVARGSGTGLSGGAVPPDGAVVLSTGRLRGLGPVNRAWGRVRCEPGVPNEQVSLRSAPHGFHFAPDPSSQSTASIGGNIAENAGGPHCLRHGVTLQHLLSLQWVGADGQVHTTGCGVTGERGLDLLSLMCGSEGTLGVVTTADLKLVPNPPTEITLLAFFPVLEEATSAVVQLLGQGLLPVAVEIVDQTMLHAIEEAFGFGFPTDVQAAMITEFSGTSAEVEEDGARATTLLQTAGAREVRQAVDDAERVELWKCRKKAFGAVGRLAPSYVTMDVVVPLGKLPALVRRIQEIKSHHGVEIATAFHAGDGNLHPGVHYDDQNVQATKRAHAAADDIIAAGLEYGGSVTGEHGVGIEKLHVLPWQIDAVTARLQREIKHVFDPANLMNPGKLLTDPAADYAPVKPLPGTIDFQWQSLTVTVPAGARLSEIQRQALDRGLWLPIGVPGDSSEPGLCHDPTVAELLGHLSMGPALYNSGTVRDFLLESWFETGTGEMFHVGAPVFKNVAGYDLVHMLCGSGDVFVRPLAATFQLRPRPEMALVLHLVSQQNDTPDLAVLWDWLATTNTGLAQPQVVADPGDGVYVFMAGRDRPWHLAQLVEQLSVVMAAAGWRAVDRQMVPFAEAASLPALIGVPDWARGGPSWTSLKPLPTTTSRAGPGPDIRQVRQPHPALFWTPEAGCELTGWHADPLIADGAVTPLPEPCPGVPRAILRGLKSVFDPHGVLPTPPWLSAPKEGR